MACWFFPILCSSRTVWLSLIIILPPIDTTCHTAELVPCTQLGWYRHVWLFVNFFTRFFYAFRFQSTYIASHSLSTSHCLVVITSLSHYSASKTAHNNNICRPCASCYCTSSNKKWTTFSIIGRQAGIDLLKCRKQFHSVFLSDWCWVPIGKHKILIWVTKNHERQLNDRYHMS